MAKTANINIRIDPETKSSAEKRKKRSGMACVTCAGCDGCKEEGGEEEQ